MLSKKKFLGVALSLVLSGTCIAIVMTSCSQRDEIVDNLETSEEYSYTRSDTLYFEAEVPTIQLSNKNMLSDATKNRLSILPNFKSRSESDLNVYYLKDKISEKCAYAVTSENCPNMCIFECYGSYSESATIIIIEQIDDNVYVSKNIEGEILRYFIFDDITHELWTYNESDTRGMSKRDQIMCNSAFTAAGWLIGEALAIPTGGTSLLVGLGFTIASSYICK